MQTLREMWETRGLVAEQERVTAALRGEIANLRDDMQTLRETWETRAQLIEATSAVGELSREKLRIDYLLGEMEGIA